jgi:uncharacterized protein YgiM (DUF1202 family)
MKLTTKIVLGMVVSLSLSTTACAPVQPVTIDTAAASESATASEATPTSTEYSAEPAVEVKVPVNAPIATVNTRSLRVRKEADENGEVIYGIKSGESYSVLAISPDSRWLQLVIPGSPEGMGWVDASFLTLEGDISNIGRSEVADEEIAAEGKVRVTTDGTRLRVRSEPNADAQIVGYVYNNEVYNRLSISADGLWTQIDGQSGSDNPVGGWVSSEFLLPE